MRVAVLLVLAVSLGGGVRAQQLAEPDVLLQGFYWNVHPGDHASNTAGVWWDSLRTEAPRLRAEGIGTVWLPSPFKGAGGRWSMGYDIFDHYDLGAHNQKGSLRTRFGTADDFFAMMAELDRVGLRQMADAVLNHRDGANSQSAIDCIPPGRTTEQRWNVFQPLSRRYPATARNFHPNDGVCNEDAPYNDRPFGQDQGYFNDVNDALVEGAAGGGWYNGPHTLGFNADSLVVWGRYLVQTLGFDEVRVDAIKHIDPAFLAPWLVELRPGDPPYAVGEFFGSNGEIVEYVNRVNAFNGAFGPPGGRNADLSGFDFGLRFALKDMTEGGGFYDMRNLNTAGMRFGQGVSPFRIATFVENHDFDRIGFIGASCTEPGVIRFGLTCTKFSTDSGHAPNTQRKHLAYAYILAAEGRPTVFWKDLYWFGGLRDDLRWLMALRRYVGQGGATPMSGLNPNPEANQADLWVLRRDGFGSPRYGSLLALNDNNTAKLGAWVNSPHTNYELKDYTDSFLFKTTRAFGDGRAFVEADPGNYAWYAPTGLLPRPYGEPGPTFALEAQPGGRLHFVVLRAEDAARFVVNGRPLAAGDEVAVLGPSGSVQQAAGIGRVGQRYRWDGVHDLLIEVQGGANAEDAYGGLLAGAPLRLAVYDAQGGTFAEVRAATWAAAAAPFTFAPDRPASRGPASFPLTVSGGSTFAPGAISQVTAFTAGFGVATDPGTRPARLTLDASHPNPATTTATLRFTLAHPGPARLTVFDVLGREVARPADGWHPAGPHTAALDVSPFPSGVYLFRLDAHGQSLTRRLTVAR